MIDFFGGGGALKPKSATAGPFPLCYFPTLIDLYLQGRFPLDKFVSETIALDGVEEALALIPAALTTCIQRATSVFMIAANSSGELPTVSEPSAARIAFISSVRIALIDSALSRSMMGCGVLAGAIKPIHDA